MDTQGIFCFATSAQSGTIYSLILDVHVSWQSTQLGKKLHHALGKLKECTKDEHCFEKSILFRLLIKEDLTKPITNFQFAIQIMA